MPPVPPVTRAARERASAVLPVVMAISRVPSRMGTVLFDREPEPAPQSGCRCPGSDLGADHAFAGHFLATATARPRNARRNPSKASPNTTCEVPSHSTADIGSLHGGFWICRMGKALACVDPYMVRPAGTP